MREFFVRRAIGEEGLRIGVDATRIRYRVGSFPAQRRRLGLLRLRALPQQVVNRLDWFIYETSSFRIEERALDRIPAHDTDVYRKMKDVFDHRENLKASATYDAIARQIEATGAFRHKRYTIHAHADIEDCIRACFLDIMESMARSGYIADKVSEFATGGLGSAFIDRDGSLLKAVGASHWFAAAQVVGLEDPFPLRIIGAHASWLRAEGIVGRGAMRTLADRIQDVERKNATRAAPV